MVSNSKKHLDNETELAQETTLKNIIHWRKEWNNVLSFWVSLLLVLIMISFFGIMVIEVLLRKLAGRSLYGSYEICGILMIWISMLGGYLAYREGEFVRLTFILERFPFAVRRGMETVRQVTVLLFLIFLTISGFIFVFSPAVLRQVTTAFRIPALFGYLPVPLGFLLMALVCYEQLFRFEGKTGIPVSNDARGEESDDMCSNTNPS